ncbi:MAG: protein kinase [Gammaproteobacteria bacterium]|nr:protein kinase [Gammaproteobacteria bacterium]
MKISGYKILETLSTRASTSVFLALDERNDRKVALKIISVENERARNQAENLLDCAKALKADPHPNVCQVLDEGQEGNNTYVAYEWLGSFDLTQALAAGMSLTQIKGIFVRLARAVQHLETNGLVHGDIKPQNILLRDNLEPILIDVSGGSFASGNLRSNLITPGYSSPESVRGTSVDSHSDIYSLGIVIYRTLCGEVPWIDESGIGRASSQEDTVPRLPVDYLALQPVIDTCLAFEPRERELDPEVLIKAFDDVAATTIQSSSIVRSDLVRSEELAIVNFGGDRRTSSGFDTFSPRRRAAYFAATFLGPIFLIAGTWIGYVERSAIQEFFSGLGIVEHPEFEERWRTAEALQSDANQTLSAITSAYNRVLEVAPNHQAAIREIDDVRNAWKLQISQFIEGNNLTLAQSRLDELARVYPNDEGIDDLSQQLYRMRRADRLMDDTRRLQELRGTEDQESLTAIILAYKQIVRQHPDHPASEEAQSQLNMLSKSIAEMSLEQTKRGNLPLARDLLGLAVEASPASADLRSAQEELQQAQSLQEEIEGTLQVAATHRQDGSLVSPLDENAYASFQRVLELDPENQVAINGLAEVEANVMLNLIALMDERSLDEANELIEAARAQGVSQESLEELETLRTDELSRIAEAEDLYDEAVELYEQGYVTRPDEANALFKLNQAQLLDPRNVMVQSLIDQCADRIAKVARDAFEAGMTESARWYLDFALSIENSNSKWQSWHEDWFPGEDLDSTQSNLFEQQPTVTAESIGQ